MKKTAYHHGNLKEEFLRIAFDFIKTEDIKNLTLKVLSDATGTSRSAIYRHFDSKDALIEKMVLKSLNDFNEVIVTSLKDKGVLIIDKLQLFVNRYIQFAKENPSLYRLLFDRKYKTIRETLESNKESGFFALKMAIEEGQKSAILKKGDSYQYSVLLFSSLHGLCSLLIDEYIEIDTLSIDLIDKILKIVYI